MRSFRASVLGLGTLLVLVHAACAAAGGILGGLEGPWTIEAGRAAPWVKEPPPELTGAGLKGGVLRFEKDKVAGPAPLACEHARYEFAVMPAEGLFQGNLTAPASSAAVGLGITHVPVMTLEVVCDKGIFDYHVTKRGSALLALDNVIWTLTSRVDSPKSDDASPDAIVLTFLTDHMTGDMGFDRATFAAKRGFFTPDAGRLADAYFARPDNPDEVPPIDGDPFTNSQEYPSRFTLPSVSVEGERATVTALFDDSYRKWPVRFVLRRNDNRWLLDDVLYDSGPSFRDLLAVSGKDEK